MGHNLHQRISRRGMLAGSLGTIVTAGAVGLPAACSGQIYPDARAWNIELSGKSPQEAEDALRTSLQGFEAHAVTYSFEDRVWEASLAELGMAIDYGAMVGQAMRHGRDGGVIGRYSTLIGSDDPLDVPLMLQRDDNALRSFLEGIWDEIAIEPRDARLEMQDGEIAIVDHVAGRQLDVERAAADTTSGIADGVTVTIALDTVPIEPEVVTTDLQSVAERARAMVSGPVFFAHDGSTYPVDAPTLAASLAIDDDNEVRFETGTEAMAARLDAIAMAVYVPPQNVKLGWDGELYVVDGDVDGVEVDREALETALPDLVRSTSRKAPLPVRPVRAAARADNLEQLGIEGHLAYGASSFAGSSDARRENVGVSARNISYKLVEPGGIFSFNELLGPITEENGFVEGTIIQGDWEASDLGGGVCQVSTTVFRAAANAGFQFAEWNPHSWRLAFYEADGSPPGFDAAIYQADDWGLDLAFQNPLDSWLLLMMVVEGDVVSAHLYGRDNGWTVALGEPRFSEPKPIPEPVERVNPDLAPGDRIKVQNAKAGVTVSIRRTVTAADGSIVSDGDFISDYRSVPEAWEVGPS